MRKVLLAVDSLNLNMASIDFACYIALLTKSRLTGVFLENILVEEIAEPSLGSYSASKGLSSSERQELTNENIRFFREACEKRGIQSGIHRDRGLPSGEIIEESRFADLIIMEPSLSFKKKMEGAPSAFAREVLEQSECPVLIAPDRFEGIDELVYSYDGSKSSVYAIKQFTYLVPELYNKKITLLEVNKPNELTVKSKPKISEWLKVYYQDIHFEVINGEVDKELFKYALQKKNILLVMGAYGRSMISLFLQESRASLVVKSSNFPIFISHH